MALGGGKYDSECTLVRERTNAEASIVNHSRQAKDNSTVRSPLPRSKPKFTTAIIGHSDQRCHFSVCLGGLDHHLALAAFRAFS